VSVDFAKMQEIFLTAVERHRSEEWQAYLDEACGADDDLRRQVNLLLQAHQEAGSLPDVAPGELDQTDAYRAQAECPGTVIGPYKLLQQIGEGGMGTVWVAEQAQPVQRKVALKLIKAGMDTKRVIARFEAERQALAVMDHPNIAKVFDGGTTETGRPFFVMELVKGVPITKYCDEHRLTLRERLELFLPACQAIQHAHQKGIIHRDVKPSNVLVAPYDGRAVVKVIDFGVAKATGQRLTEKTLFTELGAVVGTLEYMSPEQAELNNQDIDTRSDIYSLGVLLYELLTGTTPLDRARLKKSAFTEMLRIIREEEPPKPSTRLSESTDTLPSISAQRQTEPAKLMRLLRGELDWIVMKTLEKDRNRRYQTANSLAGDVERYLRDEPVVACPPSALYRFRKFARRNKARLAGAALIMLCIALLGGGAGWVIRDRAARQAKMSHDLELALDRADLFQGEGKRAEALAAVERAELLTGQAPPQLARRKRLAAVKERLAAEARDQAFIARFEEIRLRVQSHVDVAENQFTSRAGLPEIRDALRHYGTEIGVMAPAEAAARVQGRPEPVRLNLISALDECLRLAPTEDAPTRQWLLATLAAAETDAWRERARKAVAGARWEALEQLAREADVRKQPPSFLLFVAENLPAQMRPTRLDLFRRIQRAHPADLWANKMLASELQTNNGQQAETIRYYTAALALRPDNPGLYFNRGFALGKAGAADEAIADYRQAVALAPQYVHAHGELGNALWDKGHLDGAIAEFREVIRIKKDDAIAHNNLGNVLRAKGQLDEAIAEFREAIRIKDDAMPHNNLGVALRDKGHLDDAIAEHREAIRLEKDNAMAHNNLGCVLRDKGHLDDAIAEYREAIRLKNDYAEAHDNLGVALEEKGRLDEAIAECREAIRIKNDYATAHYDLGIALRKKGHLDEAITEYREAIRLKNDYTNAHFNLGDALKDKGRLDDAVAEHKKTIDLRPDFAEAHCNLGNILRLQGQFTASLDSYKRGHALGSKRSGWHYPSARWVAHVERLVRLEAQLPDVLAGKGTPADNGERLGLLEVCRLTRRYFAAARLSADAFAANPKLADDLKSSDRYNAACFAALAAAGQGIGADKLDDQEQSRLRQQALAWLRADLEQWSKQSKAANSRDRQVTLAMLKHWQRDTDLAGVRDADALIKRSAQERDSWRKLWADVAELLKKDGSAK
jgi:serine/threonine protein kinase/Flp pilus assembly protein TadD